MTTAPDMPRRAPRRSGPRLARLPRPVAAWLLLPAIAWLALAAAATADDTLADLIQAGDRDAALALIRGGADVGAAQGDGTTPLHWAVYRIDTALVDALLERGADPSATNLYGSTPLGEAVNTANVELVARLLEAGADPDAPNLDGQTALMLATRSGSMEIVELLVARGADVNVRETWRGQTALMWAADSNRPEIARHLIDHGATVELRAVANDWPVQITSEPRAQYRPTGGLTPLLYAARAGCTGCVDAMLDAGADVNRPNPDGVTPLIIAIDNYRFDTALRLLERGANPHLWDWWGRTALYTAVDMSTYSARRGGPEPAENGATALDVIEALLDAGVDPNPQLNMHRPNRGGNIGRFVDDLLTTGATPLLRAATGHDVDAVRTLLAHGARVDLPNVMGVTPFMAAAGIGISGRDRGVSAGGDAEARVIETLDLLLAAGADVNARVTDVHSRSARIARASTMTDREGQTALYGAVRFAWARVVAWLIEHGAAVDVVDALGRSPLDGATGGIEGRGDTPSEEVAEILRQALGA